MSPRWHDDYERGRPSYPPEALDVAGLPQTAEVLELGAGTGKLTRLLLDHFGFVLAVEPDPGMRRQLTARCPDSTVLAGTAEHLALADASVDAVYVAEAFHWFDHERALVEVARVLRPGGTLVLMWNRPVGPPAPPITAVEQLLAPIWPDDIGMPLDLDPRRFGYARDWPLALARSAFEPLREASFANPHLLDRDQLVAFFGSMGWISSLPEHELVPLLDQVRARLTADKYLLPFETHVHWATLSAP